MSLSFGGPGPHDLHIQYVGRGRQRRTYWECSCGRHGPEVSEVEAELGAQAHLEQVQRSS